MTRPDPEADEGLHGLLKSLRVSGINPLLSTFLDGPRTYGQMYRISTAIHKAALRVQTRPSDMTLDDALGLVVGQDLAARQYFALPVLLMYLDESTPVLAKLEMPEPAGFSIEDALEAARLQILRALVVKALDTSTYWPQKAAPVGVTL